MIDLDDVQSIVLRPSHAGRVELTFLHAEDRERLQYLLGVLVRQVTTAQNSVADSRNHTSTVMITSRVSCSYLSCTSNSPAMKESLPRTTTSTAAPISSSGMTSQSLLAIERVAASHTRPRWPRA